MAFLLRPCPFYNERHGAIELHPEIETQYSFTASNSKRYPTEVTVTCTLVAECNCCTFSEIADSESKDLIFDLTNHTPPSERMLDSSGADKSGKKKRRSGHANK